MGELTRRWDDLFRHHQNEDWKQEAAAREQLVMAIRRDCLTEVLDALSTIEETLVARDDMHGAAVCGWIQQEVGSIRE